MLRPMFPAQLSRRPMHRRNVLLPLFALPVVLAACRAIDDTTVDPAWIVVRGDSAAISMPDTVMRGVGFPVSVETFGGGCTRQVARTELKVTGSVVEIRPFNETIKPVGRQLCTADFLILTHSATVEIKQAGPAAIRVIADERDLAGRVSPALIQRAITVLP